MRQLAAIALLIKERRRLGKVMFYRDLYTGKYFGLTRAIRYLLKNPPSYDEVWEVAMEKAEEFRRQSALQASIAEIA